MNKIFAETQKPYFGTFLGLFERSKPSASGLSFKNWDPSLFSLYDVKLNGKKNSDDPEILHCRRMEKRTKPNL